jgi:hypothetical protein
VRYRNGRRRRVRCVHAGHMSLTCAAAACFAPTSAALKRGQGVRGRGACPQRWDTPTLWVELPAGWPCRPSAPGTRALPQLRQPVRILPRSGALLSVAFLFHRTFCSSSWHGGSYLIYRTTAVVNQLWTPGNCRETNPRKCGRRCRSAVRMACQSHAVFRLNGHTRTCSWCPYRCGLIAWKSVAAVRTRCRQRPGCRPCARPLCVVPRSPQVQPVVGAPPSATRPAPTRAGPWAGTSSRSTTGSEQLADELVVRVVELRAALTLSGDLRLSGGDLDRHGDPGREELDQRADRDGAEDGPHTDGSAEQESGEQHGQLKAGADQPDAATGPVHQSGDQTVTGSGAEVAAQVDRPRRRSALTQLATRSRRRLRNSRGRSRVVLGAVRCVTPGPHPFAATSGHSPRGVRRAAPTFSPC